MAHQLPISPCALGFLEQLFAHCYDSCRLLMSVFFFQCLSISMLLSSLYDEYSLLPIHFFLSIFILFCIDSLVPYLIVRYTFPGASVTDTQLRLTVTVTVPPWFLRQIKWDHRRVHSTGVTFLQLFLQYVCLPLSELKEILKIQIIL